MKKSIDQLLADLNGLVEQYGAMEAETTFASGDLVTYEGRNGTIESFDQDGNYAVRMMDDDMEATDEVVTLTAEQMQKYVKPEVKSDDDLIDEEEEEQEYKSGDFVSFVSQEGVTYGQIVETNENNYTIEVYTPVDSKYEATGVEVTHKPADLKKIGEIAVKENPKKILAKFIEIKMMDDDDVGVIEGYASTFGNADLGGDRVNKGAFNQTFMHKKTRKVFFDHFYGVPDLAGVGTFSVDEKGLYMRAELPLKSASVKDAYEKIKFLLERDEDMGLSIGYNTVKSRMSPEGIRDLLELAVMETSITPFPMNTEALIMSAKSRKIGYQAKRQAWQTIVHKEQTDAPDGNQLNEGDIRSLIEEVKTLIQNQ
jgi:uncharacterized protein